MGVLPVLDRHALRYGGLRPVERSHRSANPASRPGDLPRRSWWWLAAQHMAQLLAGRLVQGLGSGAMNVAIFVCVAQAYSIKQRPKMFTYISTAWVLPAFVGPPASAWLTERLSWHWVFFAVIPLALFGGVMALPSLLRMIRLSSAWQRRRRVQASAVVGCCAFLRRHRCYATCWAAAGLDRAGTFESVGYC